MQGGNVLVLEETITQHEIVLGTIAPFQKCSSGLLLVPWDSYLLALVLFLDIQGAGLVCLLLVRHPDNLKPTTLSAPSLLLRPPSNDSHISSFRGALTELLTFPYYLYPFEKWHTQFMLQHSDRT